MGANKQTRPIHEIAREIRADWVDKSGKSKVYFGAVPYLNAMVTMDHIPGNYYADPASSVVAYFLSNATSWRGETARRVKAELKAML